MVPVEVFRDRFHALINLDLLDARIALNVEDAFAFEQVVIEFLGAAHIQYRVGLSIKFSNSLQRQSRGGDYREDTVRKNSSGV